MKGKTSNTNRSSWIHVISNELWISGNLRVLKRAGNDNWLLPNSNIYHFYTCAVDNSSNLIHTVFSSLSPSKFCFISFLSSSWKVYWSLIGPCDDKIFHNKPRRSSAERAAQYLISILKMDGYIIPRLSGSRLDDGQRNVQPSHLFWFSYNIGTFCVHKLFFTRYFNLNLMFRFQE